MEIYRIMEEIMCAIEGHRVVSLCFGVVMVLCCCVRVYVYPGGGFDGKD